MQHGAGRQTDRLIVNGRVLTLDLRVPDASAIWIHGASIVAVGDESELRRQAPARAEVLDAEGGLMVSAFHDPHLHLLSYARAHARLDSRDAISIAALQGMLRQRARTLTAGAWLRAINLDESQFPHGQLPDRHDLDRAAPDRPVRLQHRTGHADVLNTAALAQIGLLDSPASEVERDARTGQATGRIFQGAALLRGRLPRPSEAELAADVRAASRQLLAWGVSTVQDASETNGSAEWALFQRLQQDGDLGVRLFMLVGGRHQNEVQPTVDPALRLSTGPVKVMVNEATTDPRQVSEMVTRARRAGRAVALHAVSDAEVAIAVEALQQGGPRQPTAQDDGFSRGAGPHRARRAGPRRAAGRSASRTRTGRRPAGADPRARRPLSGGPSAEQHDWLYRVRSLQAAGVPYAASSDAPLTEPSPGLALYALRSRTTRAGALLGPSEALTAAEALACVTTAPAQAIGVANQLGTLRPGALADIAVLAPDALSVDHPDMRPARLTILGGDVVWRDGVCYQS